MEIQRLKIYKQAPFVVCPLIQGCFCNELRFRTIATGHLQQAWLCVLVVHPCSTKASAMLARNTHSHTRSQLSALALAYARAADNSRRSIDTTKPLQTKTLSRFVWDCVGNIIEGPFDPVCMQQLAQSTLRPNLPPPHVTKQMVPEHSDSAPTAPESLCESNTKSSRGASHNDSNDRNTAIQLLFKTGIALM